MAKGTIYDPRQNTVEKEYGILIAEKDNIVNGGCKEFVYLKDGGARYFTFGTPVKFDIEERNIDHGKGVAVEVGVNVKVDEIAIADHPVIRNLNRFAELLLKLKDSDNEKLIRLANDCSDADVIAKLKEAVESLVGPFEEKGDGG